MKVGVFFPQTEFGSDRTQQERTLADIGIGPRLYLHDGNLDVLQKRLGEWQTFGATHISFNTMGAGLKTAAEHIQAIRQFAENL